MRALPLLLALLLPACVAPAIDRADAKLEARVEQVAVEARQTAQDAIRRVDEVRAAAVADVAQRVSAERAATLSDVDSRLAARVSDLDARTDAKLGRVETLAAAFLTESAKWREEVAAWRAEAASLRAAFTGQPAPAASAPTSPGGLDGIPSWLQIAMLCMGTAGSIFTTSKTVARKLKAGRGAA